MNKMKRKPVEKLFIRRTFHMYGDFDGRLLIVICTLDRKYCSSQIFGRTKSHTVFMFIVYLRKLSWN